MRDLAGLWGLFEGTVNDRSGRRGYTTDMPTAGTLFIAAIASRRKSSAMPFGCISGSPQASHGRGNVGGLGIGVTSETVRQWGRKFGKAFSDRIRQRAPARGDKWHLDEVVISIAGAQN